MCVGCPDWVGCCSREECGALPPVDENGNRRRHYLKHFYLDGPEPCEHVKAEIAAANADED